LVNRGGGGTDPYSIVAWVYLQSLNGQQCIFSNGDLSQAGGVFLYVDNGTVKAQRGGTNTSPLASVATLQTSQWYDIAYTYDGTTQNIYINGAPDSSGGSSAIPSMAQGALYLGASFNGFVSGRYTWATRSRPKLRPTPTPSTTIWPA
jgi:hypothetical protein